ncbi:helix-turn-helix transcriptional regulator [Anaerofilum sp. BX8]|uniref:Helix-turn-helix transcriptional regulator n=1 Tax=Anaerofilum hominis TaxID=2763016 RepID=A0A923I7I9_9FIRM|nr:helix-turn-helix transcriptional regulator [Anaerofilum hominis]
MKNQIRELRRALRVSQGELAARVGVTRQTIISLENEKYTASLALAYKIARFFGCRIEDVFDFAEIEEEFQNGTI